MELYKLCLPIHLVKTIISFNYQEISEAEMMMWKTRLGLMKTLIHTNILKSRGVEEDMICFGVVYNIPSFEYLREKMKISYKRYLIMKKVYAILIYDNTENARGSIKQYIEKEQLSIERTVTDFNNILRITFDQRKKPKQ